jgi:hypothetical protein
MQGDQEPELYSETLSQKKKKKIVYPNGIKGLLESGSRWKVVIRVRCMNLWGWRSLQLLVMTIQFCTEAVGE